MSRHVFNRLDKCQKATDCLICSKRAPKRPTAFSKRTGILFRPFGSKRRMPPIVSLENVHHPSIKFLKNK
ncbi:hypothetical protein HanXRQr2_Chr02g0075831 [Helianthus annuus]|uniref:Uncharacterized protein n=1 Tax=Helianthus annuus TaxID=4232 RepID=A0A9K3JRH2_HELAN|nr:hypothetical protein HanXRQr2_Chr02g0075831 [Helianthus annuus]KAJ0952540.1 hypothetical protein HanPSC8_Chr02g0073431 [Helianthus annuus]